MTPRVSVIIPVYNVEKYLGECLDSVLGQTLTDIEVVCVDDGSTDGSSGILARYAARDPRVKVLRQANAGPGPARNAGLDAATGAAVAFMDPDDRYPAPDVLEALSRAREASGLPVVGGRARCFPEDDPAVAKRNEVSDRMCAFPHTGVVAYADYQIPYRYWCYLYDAALLKGLRFPDLRTFQDVPFFVAAMARAGRFFALDRVVYAYRIHPANGSQNLTPAKRRDRLAGMGLVMRLAARNGYWRLFDHTRRAFRINARQTNLGGLCLLRLAGVRNEAWHRVRKLAGVSRPLALTEKTGGRRRKGAATFLRRAVNSLFTGMFAAKVRRHLFKTGVVRRFVAWRAAARPVVGNKVAFMTFAGTCSCNPRYIARALAATRPDADIVWLLGNAEWRRLRGRPETGRAVRMWTFAAMREIATARVWVDNAQGFLLDGLPRKRAGQFYLNTWHGSLGLKRLDTAGEEVRARRRKMAAVDAVLSNSDFEDGVFRTSFFPATPLLRTGHPRNDVFFRPDAEKAAIRAKVRAALRLPDGVRLALYAPTFREDAFASDAGARAFGAWAAALSARFGGVWRVALRLHPHDAKALADGLFALPPDVLDASGYDDMQELLVAAEAGVTDYSSWIFDFLLGGAPGFIFAPDLAAYDQSRGFYYPLSETPFPVAETEDALLANIRAFDAARYAARTAVFLAARGCQEDGRASDRVAALLAERLADGGRA